MMNCDLIEAAQPIRRAQACLWATESDISASTALPGTENDVGGAVTTLCDRPSNYSNYAILCEMVQAAAGWGDHGPSASVVHAAHRFVDRLAMLVAGTGRPWITPHVPASIGGVVLEWWRGSRKLTIDVNPDLTIDFTRVWGPDMVTEMADGRVSGDAEQLRGLWAWLTSNP